MSALDIDLADEFVDVEALSLAPDEGWNALYVDGEWVAAGGRETIDVLDPSTRSTLTTVPAGTDRDVDEAFAAAERAQAEWARRPP
jgi:aldehyde dehydrogenase (NAD+)